MDLLFAAETAPQILGHGRQLGGLQIPVENKTEQIKTRPEWALRKEQRQCCCCTCGNKKRRRYFGSAEDRLSLRARRGNNSSTVRHGPYVTANVRGQPQLRNVRRRRRTRRAEPTWKRSCSWHEHREQGLHVATSKLFNALFENQADPLSPCLINFEHMK